MVDGVSVSAFHQKPKSKIRITVGAYTAGQYDVTVVQDEGNVTMPQVLSIVSGGSGGGSNIIGSGIVIKAVK